MPEAIVQKLIPMPSGDPARKGAADTWVIYVVDGKRTETIRIPKSDPTEAEVQAAIRAAEKSRAAITAKPFKL